MSEHITGGRISLDPFAPAYPRLGALLEETMLPLASWLATGHLLTSLVHPADFQLAPGFQAQSSSPETALPGAESSEPIKPDAAPRYSIAHGFGNGVPLSFAVKQLVPSMFHVIYRNGVDQSLPVVWSGGRPWNQTLGTVLRQHGLRMVLIGRTVTIRD